MLKKVMDFGSIFWITSTENEQQHIMENNIMDKQASSPGLEANYVEWGAKPATDEESKFKSTLGAPSIQSVFYLRVHKTGKFQDLGPKSITIFQTLTANI